MPRGQKVSALFVVVLAVASTIYTLVAGNKPLLGLDLQGGVSVVLQPTTPADDEALDQSVEILRSRVDALGVAEPEIARQGDTIVVDLPGIEEQQRALDLVGQTAELRFRPVLLDLGGLDLSAADGTDPTDGTDGTDSTGGTATTDGTDSTGGTATTDGTATTERTATTGGPATTDEESSGLINGRFGAAAPVQLSATTATTDAPPGTTTTIVTEGTGSDTTVAGDGGATITTGAGEVTTTPATLSPVQQAAFDTCLTGEATAPEADDPDVPVLLPDDRGGLLCLGPTLLTGDALETAGVDLDLAGAWTVNPVFLSGANGIDAFNAAAGLCYQQSPDPEICPTGRLAIVLDHRVVSAPAINAASFRRDEIVISGQFDEDSARDLAAVLRFGALPVELETQQVQTVSATIGSDVLRAGLIAGAIGLGLVAIYLLFYYRLAALVTIVGLALSAGLLWSTIAYLGDTRGLALTLGGVVGLIVSIGIAADSSIVYFENVKEIHQSGRKLATAVDRAYKVAISTILKAGFVSLIAAGLLYWLTVGAVRGFAFYLGLATLFDLLIAWLFMRPALTFLTRRKGLVDRADRVLGVRSTEVAR